LNKPITYFGLSILSPFYLIDMHRLFYSLLLLGSGWAAMAQIPNPDFENWQTAPGYEYPTGWGTVAQATNGIAVTCEKSTDKYSGNFAARLFTRDLGIARVPGLLFTGTLDLATSSVKGGFPYTQRPARLNGYYKYTAGTGDSCAVFGFLTRTRPTGARDTIAVFFWQGGSASAYTGFSIPLSYLSSETPDTGLIVISASKDPANPAPNSTLWIDALSFEGSSDTEEATPLIPVFATPNPARDVLRIGLAHEGPVRVWLVESTGRQVVTRLSWPGEEVPVGALPPGAYSVLVVDARTGQLLGYTSFLRL
jgi:hypothetical protein